MNIRKPTRGQAIAIVAIVLVLNPKILDDLAILVRLVRIILARITLDVWVRGGNMTGNVAKPVHHWLRNNANGQVSKRVEEWLVRWDIPNG